MEEKNILSESGVQVTTARLVAGGQTFALRNITSVRMEPGGSMIWAVFFCIVALVSLVAASNDGSVLGFIVFGVLGGGLLIRAMSRKIIVNTSGKDSVAYKTGNRPHAERVLSALNDAIAQR